MQTITLRKQPRTRINPKWRTSRKIKVWLYMTLSPYFLFALSFPINLSLRWRSSVHPETEKLIKSGKPFIIPFWHGDLLLVNSLSRYIRVHTRTVIMVGLSQPGEIGARFLEMLGYNVVRGSRKSRPKEAMEDLMDAFRQGGIAGFAVDGPSGPAGVVKPGTVLCAREAGVPIVPVSFRVNRQWRINTWDKTSIPKPFARCIAILGAPMYEHSEEYIKPYLTTQDIQKAMIKLKGKPLEWNDCIHDSTYLRPDSEES